jgi:hypothetical protein
MTHGLRNLIPVPRSALTAAFAQIRPRMSMISEPSTLAQRLTIIRDLTTAGDPDAEAAQESLNRAQQLLDRRNWISWYKRLAEAGAMP